MEGGRRVEVPGPAAGTPTSQHPDSRDTPVLREPPLLEEVEVEGGAGTPLDTAVGGRDTTGTGASVRPAATTLDPVEATVGDTPAVATPVTATPPPPPLPLATAPPQGRATAGPRATATTPTPATPPPGQLGDRASPGRGLVAGVQSDLPPGIQERTPTAETN